MLMRENPLELIKRLFRYLAKIVTTVRDSIVSLIIEKESIKRKGLLSKDFADTCRLICVLLGIIVESRRLLIKEIIFFFYFPCNIYAFVIIRIHTFCTFI